MQFKASTLFLLGVLASSSLALPVGQGLNERSGSVYAYKGNVGNPWGSNIYEVTADALSQHQYTAKFTGQNTEPWTIVFWNKIGPDGQMDGWYGHSALTLTLNPGQTKYVAFDSNSQGGWAAAPGSSIPTDNYGGYSATWGEFDFADARNGGWSGFDVSAIQAQAAGQTVQGMQICQSAGNVCSTISGGGAVVENAYTQAQAAQGGIGGQLPAGPAALDVIIAYSH